jgi:hypothetical protein
MSDNLNGKLYKRFGLEVDKQDVELGFRRYFSNKIWEALLPLMHPDKYDEKYRKQLYEAREGILDDCCREIFLDRSDYEYDDLFSHRDISKFINHILEGSFEKMLLNMQILLNVFYKYDIVHDELKVLVDELNKYAEDFPILRIAIKVYKTKAPQVLPSKSKHFDKEIMDTLGVLDADKFKAALDDFEAGIKNFTKAKTDSKFKNVVVHMHDACDEVVKIVLDNNGKSFKHAIDKDDHKKLKLNGKQKEIFKNLKNWMDEIKHGSKKNIDRYEIEMIISIAASFIRFVAIKYNLEKEKQKN